MNEYTLTIIHSDGYSTVTEYDKFGEASAAYFMALQETCKKYQSVTLSREQTIVRKFSFIPE